MRVPVDDSASVSVASVAKGEAVRTVLVINRGPDSCYVEFDGDADAAESALIKKDDYFTRKIGRGQTIEAICDTAETAVLHVLSDPEE